jgi:hypothetical protein
LRFAGVYSVVAIAAVGIAVPPLGMGLATLIGRKYFTAEERETGKAALVMGCVGVTEGAIPFAAADPLRVIPANMIGAASGCVTAALLGAQCYAGWGGLIVLPVVQGKGGFIAALLVGACVSAACVILLKAWPKRNRLTPKPTTNWILISKLTNRLEGTDYDPHYRCYRLPVGRGSHLHGRRVAGKRRQSQRLAGQSRNPGLHRH